MKCYHYILAGAVAAALACSCDRDAVGIRERSDIMDVSVSVRPAAVTSRAGVPEPTEIDNLWVLQYDGTEDDAVLTGLPTYIQDYDPSAGSRVRLVVCPEQPCTVVFLANTNSPNMSFPVQSTISDLKSRNIGNISSPEEAASAMVLSGTYTGTVTADMTEISATLSRNLARVHFTLTNETASEDPVTITAVTLKSVPTAAYYFTSYLDGDVLFPANAGLTTFNFPTEAWEDANVVGGDPRKREFDFCVPANARGKSESSTTLEKAGYAPKSATYVEVQATYSDSEGDHPVVYYIYLGADDINDYNLRPNHSYDISYAITGHGDDAVDSRVGNFTGVDFSVSERANCYIINPPASGSMQYRIPVDRVNTFWGGNGYEDEPGYCISSTTDWTVSVIWSDFLVNPDETDTGFNFAITKSHGTGYEDCFIVTVPAGMSGHNLLLGIRPDDGSIGVDEYLWSWHLWITGYMPDESIGMAPEDGKYIYGVTNGNVHRYAGAIWETGKYRDKFIMDRNIGSPSAEHYGLGLGTLYYQYGRKDPLPGGYTVYRNGTTAITGINYTSNIDTSTGKALRYYKLFIVNGATVYQCVPYSVRHPFVWMLGRNVGTTGYHWSYGEKYTPKTFDASIIWHDPMTKSGMYGEGRKSLFDPCPAGWRMPDRNTWEDFRMSGDKITVNMSSDDLHPARNFRQFEVENGLCYWPYVPGADGTYDVDPENVIYYPNVGFIPQWYADGWPIYIENQKSSSFQSFALSYSENMHDICGGDLPMFYIIYQSDGTFKYSQGFHPDNSSSYGVNGNCSFSVRCVQD